MTSKVEEVARAIDPMAAKVADMLIAKGLSRNAVLSILPMEKARAAIKAMREPTEAMCVEGWKKADERDAILGNGEIAMVYTNMIDAALGEEGR